MAAFIQMILHLLNKHIINCLGTWCPAKSSAETPLLDLDLARMDLVEFTAYLMRLTHWCYPGNKSFNSNIIASSSFSSIVPLKTQSSHFLAFLRNSQYRRQSIREIKRSSYNLGFAGFIIEKHQVKIFMYNDSMFSIIRVFYFHGQ